MQKKSKPPLRKYQERGIEFCKKHKRAYLAVDMGLGKTRITLETLAANKKPALIFAPLRGVYSTWPDECEKWTPQLTYQILHGPQKDKALNTKADLYFVNPDGIKWLYKALKAYYEKTNSIPFEELIIDEGSMWKSSRTKRFSILQVLFPLFRNYRFILSGTPAPNSLLDLWSQYYILDEGKSLDSSFYRFRNAYFLSADKERRVWFLKKDVKEEIYKRIRSSTFRLDSKDHLELPERIDNRISLKLGKVLAKKYKDLETKFFLECGDDKIEAFNIMGLSNKLRQFVQGGMYKEVGSKEWFAIHSLKLDALKELVETSNGQGILCAIQFRFELQMIQKIFPNTPIIAGGTNAKTAAMYIKQWNDQELPLLLCHSQSLSHSVNLQSGGHLVVWFGLPWSLEQYLQLNKRLHRSGQEDNVIVHHIILRNTIDEIIFRVLTRKNATQQHLLDYLNNYRENL